MNMKRQSATASSNDTDLICIDEDDDADIKVIASKPPTSEAAKLQREASQTGIF